MRFVMKSTPLAAAAAAMIIAGSAGMAHAQLSSGFYGKFLVPDGGQARDSRAIAGASPNSAATANGVRCGYMYVVRGGVRYRHYVCD